MDARRILRGGILALAAALVLWVVLGLRDNAPPPEPEAERVAGDADEASDTAGASGDGPVRGTHEASGLEITEIRNEADDEGTMSLRLGRVTADDGEWAEGTGVEIDHTTAAGESLRMLADHGRALLAERITDVDGNVRLSLGDVVLTTERARHEAGKGRVRSEAPLSIEGPGWRVAGRGFEVDVERQRVRVLHDVVTWIEPAAEIPAAPGAAARDADD